MPARFIEQETLLPDQELEEFTLHRLEDGRYDEAGGCSETLFMTSRGGDRYERTILEGFIRPGIDRHNWVCRGNYAALGVVPTAEQEMSLYAMRHFAQLSIHLERLTLRTDGFVSVHAPYTGGEMRTKVLQFEGNEPVLNYSTGAGGHIRVELQDASGTLIAGFTAEESRALTGDEIERVIRRQNGSDVSELAGQTVRLRFVMKDADLYLLRFRAVAYWGGERAHRIAPVPYGGWSLNVA